MKNNQTNLDQPQLKELWFHYLWKEKKIFDWNLISEGGQDIQILFSGWYNRGWGPDFTEARIRIGNDELFGDVEIHIDESAWYSHNHHLDPTYNKVILHVYLNRDKVRIQNQLKNEIPSLNLGLDRYKQNWNISTFKKDFKIKELPGACGLTITENSYAKIRKLIFQAAEQRLMNKSAFFHSVFQQSNLDELEDALFSSICKSLGYLKYSNEFVKLSETYPYSITRTLFFSFHRHNRVEVLGRWLGIMGLLDSISSNEIHDDLRREWTAFQQFWSQLDDKPSQLAQTIRLPSRPLNNPLRRLTGLFYHLEKIHFQGLIKSWLKFFNDCRGELDKGKSGLKKIMSYLDNMFPQPDWEPLSLLIHAKSKQRNNSNYKLIGRQRQLIILVNSVLPFFLAWAQTNDDKDLEKTLFALFLLLPAEGQNSKTRFMEERLFNIHPDFKVSKNLSYHQGLIQLNEDCCLSFYEGCQNCSLLKLIK